MGEMRSLRDNGEHEVTITITIAKASLTNYTLQNRRNELLQVQNYFHCEYQLLPDDSEVVATDVVVFGIAAKLYTENDPKVLRTWLEGNRTWVAWTSSRKIHVNQDLLLKLFEHKLELKVWNTKDKVSAKARFDRPKAFRLPKSKAPDDVDMGEIREFLQQQGQINLSMGVFSQSTIKLSDEKIEMTFKGTQSNKPMSLEISESDHQFIPTCGSNVNVQVRLNKSKEPQFKNLLSLASTGAKPLVIDTFEPEMISEKQKSRTTLTTSKRTSRLSNGSSPKSQRKSRPSVSHRKSHGLTSICIEMSSLFNNSTAVTNSMPEPIGTLEDVIVVITLDKPLLSDRQRQILNPMVLTVGSAVDMPDNQLSFKDLQKKCVPPFVRYKFHNCEEHSSERKKHGKTIPFNDKKVFLLGTMERSKLKEYLRGPPFVVEVHDRDVKPQENTGRDGQLVGWSAYKKNSGQESPHGVASFDLSLLLEGHKFLQCVSPIKKKTSNQRNNIQRGFTIPPGDYLQSNSELKIKVELARSLCDDVILLTRNVLPCDASELNNIQDNKCVYSRLVYVSDYNSKSTVSKLLQCLKKINGEALNHSFENDDFLTTHQLSCDEQQDKSLDVITGCHIIDGVTHMFILEGLQEGAMQRLWKELTFPEDDERFRVLYNSKYSFADRLYITFGVCLTRVRLYRPIFEIVQQPLFYIRDMVPRLCFNGVIKLNEMLCCNSLRGAVRNDLLPTAPMIQSLIKEISGPLRPEDIYFVETVQPNEPSSTSSTTLDSLPNRKPELDMCNYDYERLLKQRIRGEISTKDHICANIRSLLAISKNRKSLQPRVHGKNIRVAHNYSIQTFNSTALAQNALREILREERNSRFTYSPEYHSATLDHLNIQSEIGKTAPECGLRDDFAFPGVRSSIQSNRPSKDVHEARKDELYFPWRENILHSNKLQPRVERSDFTDDGRRVTFDTLSTPPLFFGLPSPVTIHLSGDSLKKEMALVRRSEKEEWIEKLVVDDPKFKTHRCLVATELRAKGREASHQLSKLEDILKDKPMKKPFDQVNFHPRPSQNRNAVSIIDDVTERNVGFNPGDMIDVNWSRDRNTIPIKDYQHGYFERIKGRDFRLHLTDNEKAKLKSSKNASSR